jgi:putative membrane protein
MTRLNSFIIILITMCLFQACNTAKKSGDNASIDSTSAQPTAANANPMPDKEDVQFITTAAHISLNEIALGKLAQQKGHDLKIKNFGVLIVKDHARANNKLVALAKAKSIVLPDALAIGDQQAIDTLSAKSGHDFDEAYINDIITGHKNNIKAFEYASRNCVDPDIKKFAAKALPRLRNQLDAINTVSDMMKKGQ